jgi:potassium-dependent mechanosensitive channel
MNQFMRRLLFFLLALGFVLATYSQEPPKQEPHAPTKADSIKATRKKDALYREPYRHTRRKFDSTLFTNISIPTTSDYAEDLERVYQLLNKVPVVTQSFTKLTEIDNDLDQDDSALNILKGRMSESNRTFNVRNLQMFSTLLDALSADVRENTRTLNLYDTTLDRVRNEIAGLKKDSLMLRFFRDSAMKDTFKLQWSQLKDKWRQTDSLISLNGQIVNDLISEASAHTISIEELQYQVSQQLKAVGGKAFGKEKRYLWETQEPVPAYSSASLKRSVQSEQELARFYFATNRNKRFWLLLTGILFFFWVWYNFRTLRRMNRLQAIDSFHFTYVRPYPITGAMLFILSLAPLFDLHAPAIYIESIEFLLIIVLSFILRKHLPQPLFIGWCTFLFLFLLLPLTRILGLPLTLERWAELIVDSASLVFMLYFLFGKHRMKDQPRVIYAAAGLYSLFNLLAVVFNLFGRVTLAGILGATAVYAFAQTVSMAIFVRLVVEAFLLQIETSRVRKNYPETFDLTTVSKSIKRFAVVLAIALWLIVFSTNLNLFDAVNGVVTDFFNQQRQVGSFTFSLGGLVLFLGIIWLANFLQRFIAWFFGDTGDDAAMDDRGQRSRLLITRLILLVGGFLLAVAASGLSVDRITVILGALGVGVGLGLQNIVNNFVSGIILIFDRPVRIGDTVEVGDKRGRVKEIGIRSSTLLTEEGAEVIIPNGDVLSNHIVNWTLSNNHVRIALSFTIEKPVKEDSLELEKIKDIVRQHPNVLDRRDPEVIINTVSSKTEEIKVYFWIKDITKTPYTTGELKTSIYRYLDEKGIVVQ